MTEEKEARRKDIITVVQSGIQSHHRSQRLHCADWVLEMWVVAAVLGQ
jgi:hypothetical protein